MKLKVLNWLSEPGFKVKHNNFRSRQQRAQNTDTDYRSSQTKHSGPRYLPARTIVFFFRIMRFRTMILVRIASFSSALL